MVVDVVVDDVDVLAVVVVFVSDDVGVGLVALAEVDTL